MLRALSLALVLLLLAAQGAHAALDGAIEERYGDASAPVAQSPMDLLRDAKFRAAYTKALGPLARERWLARLDGPAPPLRRVTIDGVEYTLAAACKTHDCGDNNMIVLHSPAAGAVYGLVQQSGRKTVFGAPPPALAREIDGLWAEEWRRGQ